MFLPKLSHEDGEDIIAGLGRQDFHRRLRSHVLAEPLWVFRPEVNDEVLWVKLALRADCIIVSFHRDDEDGHGEEE